MATPFKFKEQDLPILEKLQDLETRDHLPDNFVLFDYSSFSNEAIEIDSFLACEFLSENFHVIIIAVCSMLTITFKNVKSINYTIIPAVPPRMLRNISHPSDHIATLIIAHLTEHAKSDDRKAYYCLSADKSFPINTQIIDLIGDEFVYCCVIKSIKDFINFKEHFQKYSDDPVNMRLYRLLQNDIPRDADSNPNTCGKIMFFHYGDEHNRKRNWPKIQVKILWQELKKFADNYYPHPLHVSVTTAFPSKRKDCIVSFYAIGYINSIYKQFNDQEI